MDLGLTDARALVGGGSGGLGGAIAQILRAEGALGRIGRSPERPADPGRRPPRCDRAASRPVHAGWSGRGGGRGRRGVRRPGPARRQLGWTAAGALRRARRSRLAVRHRRHVVERHPTPARGPAAPARGARPGDPRHPVELGARADPRADHLEPAATGSGRADQVTRRGDRPDPASTASLRGASRPTGSPRSTPPVRARRACRSRTSSVQTSTASRWGATATHWNSGAWRPSSCRPRRVLCHRRDRPGRRRDDPRSALTPVSGRSARASSSRSLARARPGRSPPPTARDRW